MQEQKLDIKKIITIGGAIVAFSIGSGFATGQELMQFFSFYGLKGSIGANLINMLLFIWICSVILCDARKLNLKSANSIWLYYCGKYVGTFLKYFTPIYFFLVLVVMTSGAGAVFNEYFGFPTYVGRGITVVLMFFTVTMGLKRLTNVLGGIGTIIIIFTLFVGIASLFLNGNGLMEADAVLSTLNVEKAAPTWWMSGVLYMSFMAVNLAPFCSSIGKDFKNNKEAKYGGIVGGGAFSITTLIMSLAILSNINLTSAKNVPTLALALTISPLVAGLFSIILFLGIYSTTVSLLYISCNFFFQDDKSRNFKIIALVGAVISFFGSSLPFAKLVGIVYPYTGYLGIFICLCIAYSKYIVKVHKNPETGETVD